MAEIDRGTAMQMEEFPAKASNGMTAMLGNILTILVCIALFIWAVVKLAAAEMVGGSAGALPVTVLVFSAIVGFVVCPILFCGLKVLKRNEAMVLTLFGRYRGTLRGEGFFFVNPFVQAVPPAGAATTSGSIAAESLGALASAAAGKSGEQGVQITPRQKKKISLKSMTLNNDRQKINDLLGNPIIIGIVVVWRVVNTAKAVFNVDNYTEFLSIQCDSALRNIVRLYSYDSADTDNEKSLRGSSQEIAERLQREIQSKVEVAGLEITEARITHLAYAPEIAAAMLQRQQASAIIDARQMIVDGAVGMVEMALNKLSEHEVVELDEERKAAMVSNLLVVLCGNRDAQPVVNSGTLY